MRQSVSQFVRVKGNNRDATLLKIQIIIESVRLPVGRSVGLSVVIS